MQIPEPTQEYSYISKLPQNWELTPMTSSVMDKNKYEKQPINTIDGVKIEFNREWVHLRKSNTEPIIRIYAESDLSAKADTLAKKIMNDIKEIIAEKVLEK